MPTNVTPSQPAAREYRQHVSHTVRRTVNFASGAFVMPAAVPAGAQITSTQVLVRTAFSAGASLVLGTAPGGNDLVAAADSAVTAAGIKRPDTATLKGPLAVDTPIYGTVAGNPVAGEAVVIFHFTPDNDA